MLEVALEVVLDLAHPGGTTPPAGKQRSLRQIAGELADLGFKTSKGTVFSPGQIARIVGEQG